MKKPVETGFFRRCNRCSYDKNAVATSKRSDRADVSRLLAFRASRYIKLHLLVFSQGLETISLNCGEVCEQVFATIIRSDEAEAFGVIEPLDGTSCHIKFPYQIIIKTGKIALNASNSRQGNLRTEVPKEAVRNEKPLG